MAKIHKINLYFVFIGFLLLQISCSNSRESEKNELLITGLEQSAEFSENFLNFYYENEIERSEAEYPEYYKQTASYMRKIWYFYQAFDAMYSDTSGLKTVSTSQIYNLYKQSLDSLNTLTILVDTAFTPLTLAENEQHNVLLKNHLENAKNILLRKLIYKQPNQIRYKKYYAFQVVNVEVNSSGNSDEVFLKLEDMKAKYQHEILIDSILPNAIFSIDSSLIFGKIKIVSEFKGKHLIYGKIKISGENGMSYIPFIQDFQLY